VYEEVSAEFIRILFVSLVWITPSHCPWANYFPGKWLLFNCLFETLNNFEHLVAAKTSMLNPTKTQEKSVDCGVWSGCERSERGGSGDSGVKGLFWVGGEKEKRGVYVSLKRFFFWVKIFSCTRPRKYGNILRRMFYFETNRS
jgi:hypothetical protein